MRPERNLRLVLEYDGTDYSGFQIQPRVRTIQGEAEAALRRLTGSAVRVHGAGRTDAGVHAVGQVVSFTTECAVPADRMAPALNRFLPDDIVVRASGEAEPEFHARYSATGKIYEYRLIRGRFRAPVRGRFAQHIDPWPDVRAMDEASQCLVGAHDFAAFMAAGGSTSETVKTVRSAEWTEDAAGARFRIEGDGFLYRMVRNIVGTALEIGLGRRPVEAMAAVLTGRDRSEAGPTAPPRGLCLVEVLY